MVDDNASLNSSIVEELRQILDDCNPYVKTYMTVRDKLKDNNSPIVRLRLLGKRNRDGRRYNLPTASEVAALVVGDFKNSDFDCDIVVEEQSGLLKRIYIFEPTYFPLQYPMLFPKGEDGFRNDIEYNECDDLPEIQRLFVTHK